MGVELGRISGPLLAENLLRHGADLAFETDLLYLFVDGTGRVGVNTISPGREIDVVGTTRFNNGAAVGSDVRVTTSAKFSKLNFVNNRIQALSGPTPEENNIYFSPDQTTDPVIVANEIRTSSLQLVDSAITSLVLNSNINFTANGTGKVTFNTTQVNVNADLHATGNITWDGNVIIGNPGQDDNVTFRAEVASDLIPDVNQAYDLGSLTKRWNNLYSTNLQTENLALSSSVINGIDLLTTPGNTIFVSTTGDDTNTGLHQHSAFRTIKHALSIAQVDTEVFIYPGIYQEIFPLTVPAGVSVNGGNIRSVTIIPTSATNHLDCFLLNGETTVGNLTIRRMYYDSINDTGYAFRFAPQAKITTRSPYIQNVTVLNTGTLSDSRPIIDGGLLSEIYDAILEGGDALSVYISNVDGGIARFNDTIGFSSGDAGRGALVDGSAVHVDSNEAAILFHAVTFIVPNADGVTLTNGARSEWLNSFTYFANIGIRLTQGILGFGGTNNFAVSGFDSIVGFWGQSGIVLTGAGSKTITVNVSNVGVVTVVSVDAGAVPGYYTSTGGTTWVFTTGKFGAEIRSINSANVYGNYGATADGADTLGYLIGHNFGYIGSGGNSFNDDGLTLQANEVVEINNGHIYFDSMDHKGNFRVGNILLVNQQTGQVTFDAQSINFGASGNITLDGPGSQTIIDATKVQVGNIRIYDNNIDSLAGPVNFYAFSGITTLNTDVFVTGNVNVSNNVTVNGNVFLGDDQYDLITIYPKLTQDINPETTDTYTLGVKGVTPKVWNTAFLTTLDIDGVTQLTNNTISTLTTDTDLELISAGNGLLRVTGTDVQLDQQLTVDGTFTVNGITSLKNTEIGGGTLPFGLTQTLNNLNAYGTSYNDYFGFSAAVSESHLIVGALSENDAGGSGSGKAYVYNLDTNSLLYTLDNPNAFGTSNFDCFGYAVAIASSYFIVGAPGETKIDENDPNYNWTGKAYIFNATTGALLYTLDNPSPGRIAGATEGEGFGSAVAITNTRAIVGAFTGGSDAGGRAYIYNTATGALLYTLVNPNSFGTASSDFFGFSVAISDSYAIVGAFGEDTSATNIESGRAYIYSTTTGALLYNLNNPNPVSTTRADRFGYSVAISDSYAVVGANGERTASPSWSASGIVYIYSTTTGALLRTINNPNPVGTSLNDRFGSSVAISGSRLIVGAAVNDDVSNGPYGPFITGAEDTDPLGGGGDQSGKAYIFDIATGSLLYTLDNPNAFGTVNDDYFGQSVAISGSYAVVGTSNEDDAGGDQSGKVYIFSEPLDTRTITLTGNIGQTGNTYITGLFDNNNISVTGVGSYLQVPNINILDNVISTTTGDLDLTFTANGTGGVVFDNKLKIVDNVISNVWPSASTDTQKSILFTPDGTGSLVIDASSALTVPYSNNATRVLGVNGEIRQNSLDGEYEGYSNTGNESLTQFHSADKKTFITPELALGTNDNIIRMYVNNTIKATIDVDKMASNVLQVGNFVLSGSTINNPVTGSDTVIQPSGTGSIDANGLLFKDNSITNTLSTPLVLASTGIGYVKFTGTGAVVFPYGNTADRRLTPELGEIRYNYQLNYMEVFNGTDWIPATGTSGAAPLNSVLDIMDLWGLVLG